MKHLILFILFAAAHAAVAQTVGTVWQCNHSQYSFSSTFYLTLTENGNIIDGPRLRGYEIGAFVSVAGGKEECRGIATYAKLYQAGTQPVYAFRIWGKTRSENFSLRLLDTRTGEVTPLTPTTANGTAQTLTTSRLIFGSKSNPLRAAIAANASADEITARTVTGTLWSCPYSNYQKDVQTYFTVQLPAVLEGHECELAGFIPSATNGSGGTSLTICRGIATQPVKYRNGQPVYALRLYTDRNLQGLQFRLYDCDTREVYALEPATPIDLSGGSIGGLNTPAVLTVTARIAETGLIAVTPGDIDSDGQMTIHDLTLRINRLLTPTARTPYSGIYDSRAITPSTTPESLSDEVLERKK